MTQTQIPFETPDSAATPDDLIRSLQGRLLSLADTPENLSAPDIERMARAITQLITSIEKAEGFLRDRTGVAQPGDRLEGEARQSFLRKLKRLVENGILDELDD